MLTFVYLHCQALPSMFCRGRYKNSGDWLTDWLIDRSTPLENASCACVRPSGDKSPPLPSDEDAVAVPRLTAVDHWSVLPPQHGDRSAAASPRSRHPLHAGGRPSFSESQIKSISCRRTTSLPFSSAARKRKSSSENATTAAGSATPLPAAMSWW